MAKVMISFPDDLLEWVDRRADDEGTTRSGYLQSLARRQLAEQDADARQAAKDLLAMAAPRGGDATEFIREMRRSR